MPEDEALRMLAGRVWKEIEDAKRRYWDESEMDAADALRLADELRQYAQAIRPDWPSETDRHADLESHKRVAHAMYRLSDDVRR